MSRSDATDLQSWYPAQFLLQRLIENMHIIGRLYYHRLLPQLTPDHAFPMIIII